MDAGTFPRTPNGWSRVADSRCRPCHGLASVVRSPGPSRDSLLTRDDPDRMGHLSLLSDRVCPIAPRRSGGVLGTPDPRHHSQPRAAGAADLRSSIVGAQHLGLSEPPDGSPPSSLDALWSWVLDPETDPDVEY